MYSGPLFWFFFSIYYFPWQHVTVGFVFCLTVFGDKTNLTLVSLAKINLETKLRTYKGTEFNQWMIGSLQSHEILECFNFPGLEGHGIQVLVVKRPGKWCPLYKIN